MKEFANIPYSIISVDSDTSGTNTPRSCYHPIELAIHSFRVLNQSQLEEEISSLSGYAYKIQLFDNQIIYYNIFSDNELDTEIIQTIATFCKIFPANYDGLTINVALNPSNRVIEWDDNPTTQMYARHRICGKGFCSCGYVDRDNRILVATKKQEIIKTLFHHLLHFIGISDKFDIFGKSDVGEAYVEFLSVLLFSMWHSLKMKNLKKIIDQEFRYSHWLSAILIVRHGYDETNYTAFLDKSLPVKLIEQVILRTFLFYQVHTILDSDWFDYDPYKITRMAIPSQQFDSIMKKFIEKVKLLHPTHMSLTFLSHQQSITIRERDYE